MATRVLRSANDEYQLVLALRDNRKQRHRQRRFLVESVSGIKAAVANGWELDSLWYAGGRTLSGWATSLLDAGVASRRYELAPDLMERLSAKDETSEVIAVVVMPADDLARIEVRSGLVVALDRPVSPGNLGSTVRSSDAFGADGVVVTGHAADPFDPQAVRASIGSLFTVPTVRAESAAEVVAAFPDLHAIGSSAGAARAVDEVDLARPLLLAIGNETHGLSAAWRESCEELVAIPMRGSADSLNAAAAASVLLYEIDRQRRA
jgi:TrmH family RNA methyltransferase